MSNNGLNCCRDWKKVQANRRHCRIISVIAGKCVDGECTWNKDRAKGRCLYEGRSVRVKGGYRIYLPDGPVEGQTEIEVIITACHTCDIGKTCDKLPDVILRLEGVKNA